MPIGLSAPRHRRHSGFIGAEMRSVDETNAGLWRSIFLTQDGSS
jgi:hypothetical protein